MGHLKKISRTHIVKKCLIALAACGLMFPSASVAQSFSQTAKQSERPVLTDGTYLFGQNQTPGQMGVGYVIFSVENNQTVGAFYQPRSSFDCFTGQISPNAMSVNIVDSYDQTVYPYEVAVSSDNTLVAGSGAGAYTLDGLYRIDEVSAQDYEMLATCKADFAEN